MKKLLFGLLLLPSLAYAERLGGLRPSSEIMLSTQGIKNQNSLQSGSTFYVSSGSIQGRLIFNTDGSWVGDNILSLYPDFNQNGFLHVADHLIHAQLNRDGSVTGAFRMRASTASFSDTGADYMELQAQPPTSGSSGSWSFGFKSTPMMDVTRTGLNLYGANSFKFYDTNSAHYSAFAGSATLSSDNIWIMPSADGTSGQFLRTDGNKVLSFATASGTGGGGYALEPATVTPNFQYGLSASTAAITALSPGVLHTLATSSQVVSGVVLSTEGGTGLTSYTQGDLIYANAANTLQRLAKDTNSTRYLSNTGGSNNPAWAQVDLTNGVTGLLGNSNIDSSSVTKGGALVAGANVTLTATAGQTKIASGFVADATTTFNMHAFGVTNIGSSSSTFTNGGGLTAQSSVTLNAGLYFNSPLKIGNYVITSTDSVILASCTTNNTVCIDTLPVVAAATGQILTITKVDSSTQCIYVVSTGTDLIDGATNMIRLAARGASLQLVSDGFSNWQPIGRIPNIPPYLGINATPNSAQAVNASSDITYIGVYVPEPCTVSAIRLVIAVTLVGGKIDGGIYNSDPLTGKPMTKLASSGPTTLGAGTGATSFNFTTPVNVIPGNYWLAVDVNNTTVTIERFGIDNPVGILVQTSTSQTLPTTAGSVSSTNARTLSLSGILSNSVLGP